MFTPAQFRAKAAEYAQLVKTAGNQNDAIKFRRRAQSFEALADNEQWLKDNYDQTVHAPLNEDADRAALASADGAILKYLGAALIMQWNTLPPKLQRELFDTASSMGELLDTASLRGQIARFLHKHKDDERPATDSPEAGGNSQ